MRPRSLGGVPHEGSVAASRRGGHHDRAPGWCLTSTVLSNVTQVYNDRGPGWYPDVIGGQVSVCESAQWDAWRCNRDHV